MGYVYFEIISSAVNILVNIVITHNNWPNNDKLAYGSNFPCHNDEAGDSDIDFSKNAKINQPYSFRDRKERVYSSTYEYGDFYFSLSEDNNGNISAKS